MQVSNVLADSFRYSVVVLPTEYGGTQVAVVVDGGNPVPLTPSYNGFLWKGSAERPQSNYYYAILDANGNVITSEANFIMDANVAGTTNFSFQREAPADSSITSTLNETFGAKYTIGDSIIKGIPRLFPKLPAYDKYSLLYQEGQVPNIRAECSQENYNTLITSVEKEISFANCTMTLIT